VRTITELKAQLQPGKQIRQIWNAHEGAINIVYTIEKVQTNGVWAMRPGSTLRSWMSFPKRGEIAWTSHGWSRVEGTRKLAEYVWVEGAVIEASEAVRMNKRQRKKQWKRSTRQASQALDLVARKPLSWLCKQPKSEHMAKKLSGHELQMRQSLLTHPRRRWLGRAACEQRKAEVLAGMAVEALLRTYDCTVAGWAKKP
jgi:hypothetical protein